MTSSSMKKVLYDTDAVLSLLKKMPESGDDFYSFRRYISTVTVIETFSKLRTAAEMLELQNVIDYFTVIKVDREIAEVAGLSITGTGVSLSIAVIAATSHLHNLTLITRMPYLYTKCFRQYSMADFKA